MPLCNLLIDGTEEGERLDKVLTQRLKRLSRSQVQRLFLQGAVRIRGKAARASTRVHRGEVVELLSPDVAEVTEAQRPDVIYEDDCLLVVNKAPGVPVQPSPGFMESCLVASIKRFLGLERVLPVHRLDRETSGVLLFTKDRASNAFVQAQFRGRTVEKFYLALVEGEMAPQGAVVSLPMGRDMESRVFSRMCARPGAPLEARTDIFCLERGGEISFVLARPRTGRQHQIRVHLSHLGYPVVGDKIYGPHEDAYLQTIAGQLTDDLATRLRLPRQALHAWAVSFLHPRGSPLTIEAPLPQDMALLWESLTGRRIALPSSPSEVRSWKRYIA